MEFKYYYKESIISFKVVVFYLDLFTIYPSAANSIVNISKQVIEIEKYIFKIKPYKVP